MNKTTKALITFSIIASFLLGISTYQSSFKAIAAALYHTSFNQNSPTTSGVVTVTTSGVAVVTDTNLDRGYLSLVNSGANGVSCFPSATTTGSVYGGGWFLAANGGALSFDSVTIYGGLVSCLTGSGTTTIGIVER